MKAFLVFAIILAAAAAFFAFQYHFILIDDGLKILKKSESGLEYTFVDGRGTVNKAKILVNPTLMQAGINDIFSGDGVTIRPKKQIQDGIDSLKEAAD